VHDYLRDTIVSTYRECTYCKSRTQFACIKCGYCYSCHWKKEELDKVRSESLATTANSAFLEKHSQAAIIIAEQSSSQQQRQHQQQQTKVIDVCGQQIEPICNYRTCHHIFSVHGHKTHICKCRHPINYTIGVFSISPLTKEERGSRIYD
jgi:hypothetical protein